ncbi:MAG: DNA-directed RNA polymerase, subunit E'' [Euryarchaeota archaeon]|jgi:DNA-directed RNA polymerase subunit E"|nr:DNA-directed RNA polymerase, subunit E'' [Euryarchaeota archaeon]MBT7938010.1 DNA-directed RNA polymerase, subunit E'' [Euryarchaeota archaeon]RZD46843.1 MAG: DNA-directed RNA polymerase subunit E'' [Euryarchaeota archaeon]HIF15798.1 DNA-directed RNA polymerase, subunit E'' [Candidatus Poseidoniales archaeon]
MAKLPFACGDCHRILDDGVEQCPAHPNAKVTTDHLGYVIILNPERAEIATRLNITEPGTYALKVNIR